MSVSEIIQSGNTVQLVINAADLKEAFLSWVQEHQEPQPAEEEVYKTPDEVCAEYHVTKPTLWRWEKSGYLTPVRFGRKVRYRLSDLKKMED